MGMMLLEASVSEIPVLTIAGVKIAGLNRAVGP